MAHFRSNSSSSALTRTIRYLYYVNDYSGGVCVKECPSLADLADPYTLVTYDGLYQVEGSDPDVAANISMADYSSSNNTLSCTEALCYPNGNPESAYTSFGVNQGKRMSGMHCPWRDVSHRNDRKGLRVLCCGHLRGLLEMRVQ